MLANKCKTLLFLKGWILEFLKDSFLIPKICDVLVVTAELTQ